MGPTIILDKSAFQSLSQSEINFLFKHYYVIVTPILISEILGDLKKNGGKGLSRGLVKSLAAKLLSIDSVVNTHYKEICLADLLGDQIPMDGRAIISGGVPLRSKNGKRGMFFEEQVERKILRDWQEGIFTDEQQVLAKAWRKMIGVIDLENFRRKFRNLLVNKPRINTLSELDARIRKTLSIPDTTTQYLYLMEFVNNLRVSQKLKNDICNRWLAQKLPSFRFFSPYAFYCFNVKTLFSHGVGLNLISTRSTNRIDLLYFYYLPFCMIFSSGDTFHKAVSPLLLRDDQEFVDQEVLKKDLQWLSNEWANLTEEEKLDRAYNYGSYPPVNEDSITYRLWKKHMRPWKPGSGNRAIKMSEKDQEKVMKRIQPMIDAIEEYEQQKEGPSSK